MSALPKAVCEEETYPEPETLPVELALPLLIQWRQEQDALVNALIEKWRRASDAERQSWPWGWRMTPDGASCAAITTRDGETLVRVQRLPSGKYTCLWALSAGTMQALAEWLAQREPAGR